MGLRYATVTGVARDDLPDGGAWLYAETIRQVHELNPDTGVEILIPDFNGKPDLLGQVFESPPRGARAQRRDGAADLQADPPGVPLRALARRAHAGPRRRPGDQVQPHPRHGRDPPRSRRRCATCTRPAATWSPSPSTCARRRATTRSSAGSSRRSSSSSPTRPRRSGFARRHVRGRWCRSSYRRPGGSTFRQIGQAYRVASRTDKRLEVPLRKIGRTVQKLPKSLSPPEVTDVRNRLRAMPSGINQMPIPKGPLPKNIKLPKGNLPPR
jgi:hypothetical protein